MFSRRFRRLLRAMRFAFVGANSRRKRLKHEADKENGCGRVAEHRRVRSRSKTNTQDPMFEAGRPRLVGGRRAVL
jgi:hypothetical protein